MILFLYFYPSTDYRGMSVVIIEYKYIIYQ